MGLKQVRTCSVGPRLFVLNPRGMNGQSTRSMHARCCPKENILIAGAAATVSADLKGSQFGQFAPTGNTPPCRLDRRSFTLPSLGTV